MVSRYISMKGWPPVLPSRQTNTIVVGVCALWVCMRVCLLFCCSWYVFILCRVYTYIDIVLNVLVPCTSLAQSEKMDSNRLPMSNADTPNMYAMLHTLNSYTLLLAIVFNLSVMNNVVLLICPFFVPIPLPRAMFMLTFHDCVSYRSLLLSSIRNGKQSFPTFCKIFQ